MKKSVVLAIILILAIIVIIAGCMLSGAYAAPAKQFKDIKSGDWFYDHVTELVKTGVISGYPDATFRPRNKLQVDHCIALVVKALGYGEIKGTASYWARGYVRKARELGIIKKNEFTTLQSLKAPCSRPEAAMLIIRGTVADGENLVNNAERYYYNLADMMHVPADKKSYVLQAYAKGIMVGSRDEKNFGKLVFFNPLAPVTRAEISTMILRLMYPEKRASAGRPTEINDPGRPYEYYDDNPVYLALSAAYPDCVNRTDDGSIIYYINSGKPIREERKWGIKIQFYDEIYGSRSGSYDISTVDKWLTEKDKPVLRYVLRLLYPTGYEPILQKFLLQGKHQFTEDDMRAKRDIIGILDGRKYRIRRMDREIWLMVGKKLN